MGREIIAENDDSGRDDTQDIISDQDQTSLHADPASEMRGGGGPSTLDLEDEPAEFARGEIDVKTQMDRTTRVARASANRHYDLDDSPDTTPGGLEEVISKTDRDLKQSTKPSYLDQDSESDEEMSAEGGEPGKKFIDIDDVSEEVDLASEQLDFGEMNEEDARESGYLDDEPSTDDKTSKTQPLH